MERSIIFTPREVQATIEGKKTVVRIPIKRFPTTGYRWWCGEIIEKRTKLDERTTLAVPESNPFACHTGYIKTRTFCRPGDILRVREKFGALNFFYDDYGCCDGYGDVSPKQVVEYLAQSTKLTSILKKDEFGFIYDADAIDWDDVKWYSPVVMPREACRLFLKVVSVRVERLQKVTHGSAIREGYGELCDCNSKQMACENCMNTGYLIQPKQDFIESWNSRYKSKGRGWDENPYVWVIEFEKQEGMHG